MTITSETTKSTLYSGNGVTTAFASGFKILSNPETGDAEVEVYQLEDDVESLVSSADYTVTGADLDAGGTITFDTAPATGVDIIIKSAVSKTQETDLVNQGASFRETYEQMVDRTVRMVQEQQETLDRAITVPITSEDDPDELYETLLTAAADATAAAAAAEASETNAATSAADAAAAAGSVQYRVLGTTTGNSTAYVATPLVPLTSYAGIATVTVHATCQSSCTINVSSLGVIALKKSVYGTPQPLQFGDMAAGETVTLYFNGTDAILLGCQGMGFDVIASASTVNVANVDGKYIEMSGVTTVNSITGIPAGRTLIIRHTGAHQLTIGANLVTLTGANMTTAAGDISEWINDGTVAARMIRYHKANGLPHGSSSFINTLLDDADAATARTTLGAAASGANSDITSLAGLTGGGTLSNYTPLTSFTPSLAFGGGSTGMTYTTRVGKYMRIGTLIIGWVDITLSAKGSSTGTATITGLPVANGVGGNVYCPTQIDAGTGGSLTGYTIAGVIQNAATSFLLRKYINGSDAGMTEAEFGNTTTVRINFSYSA